MLARVADAFSKFIYRYLPDAFVIAVIMTIFVFILGFINSPSQSVELFKWYGDGFWIYLAFTMQMVLLLMTGMVLAQVPFIKNALESLASKANTPAKAYLFTFFISAAAYYINWGLAVFVGAIVAREVGKRNKEAHFPLIVASAYTPTVLFAASLSSSVGLTIATKDHFLSDIMGVIPTSETIFHPGTITILFVLVLTLPFMIILIAPKDNIIPYNPPKEPIDTNNHVRANDDNESAPAIRLEKTPFLGALIGILGVIYVIIKLLEGSDLDLNIINMTFLSLGLIFHRSLREYSNAFKNAAKSISPIILQFPFYAAIISILQNSGLGEKIILGMSSIATSETFYLFTYWVSGLINILVPSGGGQWALQGPLQIPAGLNVGVEPGLVAMSVAWGDAWTNLIQPFWALPILSIVGLHIRHIMGYCILLSLWVGIVTSCFIYFVY